MASWEEPNWRQTGTSSNVPSKTFTLELHCAQMPGRSRLNPAAPKFYERPQKDATAVAAVRIQEIAEQPELWTLTLDR